MGSHAQGGGVGAQHGRCGARPKKGRSLQGARSYVWGPLSAFGLFVAVLACVADQAAKFWLLLVAHLDSLEPIVLTPFAELVLTWNTGISYGLFPQNGPIGPWALLAFKVVAVVFLWIWLARSLAADRLGARADHRRERWAMPSTGCIGRGHGFRAPPRRDQRPDFDWYVFNLADVAIVAGVVGLLYELLRQGGAAKAP